MKPEKESLKTLQYTQSVAKTIEFGVPQNIREAIESRFSHQPEDIFDIVIALLGQISDVYKKPALSDDEIYIEEEKLRFCAEFFDNYKDTGRLDFLNNYCLLIGAAAYYLCNLPGSSLVLLKMLNNDQLNLEGDGLENFLYTILSGQTFIFDNFSKSKYYNHFKQLSYKIDIFYKNGIDNGILKEAETLEDFAFKKGSDREIFLSDLIFSILFKKHKISSWYLLPQYSGLSKEVWTSYLSSTKSIKTLWPSQILIGKADVYKGNSCIIQLPTSSGKTKSTELIIRSSFLSGRAKIAVIIAPFRALCHEIKRDYNKAFRNENISIDEINDILTTDDLNIFYTSKDKKSIIILTLEKLYYLLHFDSTFIKNIGLIIFDEGHQFDSKERGITYELLITFLKKELPETTQKVLISAVISNSTIISRWLNKNDNVVSGNNSLPTKRNIGFFDIEFNGLIRFVDYISPRNQIYYAPRIFDVINLPLRKREKKERVFPDLKDSKSVALFLSIKMSNKGVTAIYCGTKISANATLKKAIDIYERIPGYNKPLNYSDYTEVEKLKNMIFRNLGDESVLYKTSQYGIFAHHLDIPMGLKYCIEYALLKEKIKCVVCTSTLAQGVNLPIKYLFVPNTIQGEDYISVRDFQNLIGRVARAGKITDGCIIFTKEDSFYNSHNFDLLDAANSEKCSSSLLKLIKEPSPLYNFSNINDIIDFYTGKIGITECLKRYLGIEYENATEEIKKDIKKELQQRLKYIATIENFFMLYGEQLQFITIEDFIENTLAYTLANEKEKELLHNILDSIAFNISETVEPAKRIPFAKTLQGLKLSFALAQFYDNNKESFSKCSSTFDVLELFWSFLIENNTVYHFSFIENKNLLLESLKKWINGCSYYEIWNILKTPENGKKTRFSNIDMVVNFFDSGINYNCCVMVNALAELIGDKDEKTTNILKFLQRQLKYGLPTNKEICIYELGFTDRCLVQELKKYVDEEYDKDLIRQNLLKNTDTVLEILNKYPSYFGSIFERLNS